MQEIYYDVRGVFSMYVFLLIFSFSLHAVTFSKIQSSPEGTSVLTFEIKKGKGTLTRKTNAFGPVNEWRLGTYTTKKNLGPMEIKITGLTQMKNRKSIPVHQIFYKVNDKIISTESPSYKSLEKEFAKLQSMKWNFIDGIEISSDLAQMKEYKNGNVIETKLFPPDFYCDPFGNKRVCKFKDRGLLYVK